ncbi:macrophage migration inhibitory factor homolog [Papaver somniferum]|uniref:macrophage migration inhibitory factor homolog n=1 Tax=Papaver somniferum TaxID=3469 RepID=UPI000E704D1E|nr:macrophage migration inhibitory factor homolog [Papaver somniferum]
MPCLNVSTNVKLEGVNTSPILSEISKAVANIIGKPEAYVMVLLKGSVPISFGGSVENSAFGELTSIGGLNADVNKKLSAAIAAILEEKISVSKSRFFIKFTDTKASNFGWNGSTF